MADHGPGHSRVCPSCGRRVPVAVSKCRCGTILPAEDDSSADESSGRSPVMWLVIMLALTVVVGYWTFSREQGPVWPTSPPQTVAEQPAPAPQTPPAPTAAAARVPATAPAPSAAAARRDLTPEQRAWDAAARVAGTTPQPAAPVASAAPVALPTPSAAPAAAGTLEEMVDRAMPAIVLVETTTGRGSAFFVQHDTLITNVHVVQQDAYVTLRRMDGSSVNARVQTRAPSFDIAVLKVSPPTPSQAYLPMASGTVRAGQEVIVIGSALGTLQNSVSRGIVSGLRNSGGVTLIQSDAAANPGNSGGPMLDRNGQVVGILTGGYRGQEGLNFAVAIGHARDILEGRQAALSGGGINSGTAVAPMLPGGRPVESETERRQQQGEQLFLQRLSAATDGAANLDSAWAQFRGACFQNPMPSRYDREWFAVFVAGAIPADAAKGCLGYYQSMLAEMNRFRDYMRTALQDARRAGVLPGTIRDSLSSRKLNFDF